MLRVKPSEQSFSLLNFIVDQQPQITEFYQAEIARISVRLSQLESIEEITRLIRNELAEVLKVEAIDYLLPNSQGQLRLANIVDNQASRFNVEIELEAKGALVNYLSVQPRAYLLSELEASPCCASTPENLAEIRRLKFFGVSLLMPLCKGPNQLGMLIARLPAPFAFYEAVPRLYLELLGTQLALAIQNIYLSQKISNRTAQIAATDRHNLEMLNRKLLAVREEERKHLSRELHDEVVQDLLLLQDQLEQYNSRASEAEVDCNQLKQVYERTASLVKVVREICSDLRPRLLDLSLSFSLNDMVRRFQKNHLKPALCLKIEGNELPSSEQARLVIYRVAQEALHNCLKHSQAEQVYMLLRFKVATEESKAAIELVIKDNGRGFEPPANIHDLFKQDHLGLVGMYERVTSCGGRLWITSVVGGGTKIMVRVPTDTESQPD